MDTSLPVSQLDPIGAGVYTGVGDLYSAYLGPLPILQRTDSYAKRNVQTWEMPEAYKGQNLYLRDTVEDLMFTSNQTYLTQRILPLFATDQVNMQWEHFEANAHLMDLTPYQTTSHAVTQKRQIRRAQLVRHGIMAEFENDFLRTAMGRTRFLAALGQISRSVIETMNAEIVRALVTSHRYQQQFVREAGMPQDQQLKYFLEQDRERFAIAQKTKNGLEKLNLLINKEMSSYRGEADCFLIPEEISIFTQIVRPEKTDYYLAGQLGPDRVNNAPGSRGTLASGNTQGALERIEPRHMIQDVPVYIVKNLQVENVSEAESQMLTRVRQIGEYTTMIDDCPDYSQYRTDHRSILMYNQDIDDMTKITLENAIENCGLWDENGEVRPLQPKPKATSLQRQDEDQDFMTYLRPATGGTQTKRSVVDYIFDIAPEYLSAKKVVNGGESLKQAIFSQIGLELKSAFEKNVPTTKTFAVPWSEIEAGEEEGEIAFAGALIEIAYSFKEITGGKSAFFDFAPKGESNAETLYKHFFIPGRVPVKKTKARSQFVESRVSSDVDNAFFQTLMSQVPASKKAEVQAAVDNHVGSTLQKGEIIRNKILEFLGENVAGLKFKDEAPVHKWFGDRVKQYNELSDASPVQSGQSTATGDDIAGYAFPGQDLSSLGYEYVHESSLRPNEDELDSKTGFRSLFDLEESMARPQTMSTSAMQQQGTGLAGIGAFVRNPVIRQQERRGENTKSRMSTYKAQLRNLEKSGASFATKIFSKMFLLTRVTRENMLSFCNNNVMVPMNFLLFRPHMQYRTRAIIKCKQDGGSGITAVGHSNLGIASESAGRKVSQMHYTTHFRSVIVYPKNVYVQPDVYVQEAEGGAGVRFYNPDTYAQIDLDNLEASLICAAVPITETHFPSPLDLSGRFYTEFNMGMAARSQYENLHYSSAARYNALYNFMTAARQGTDVPHLAPGRSHRNRVCYQGHQQNHNAKTGDFNRITVNKGHWTKNVAAGNGGIRHGAMETLETIDYSTRNAN